MNARAHTLREREKQDWGAAHEKNILNTHGTEGGEGEKG